MNPKCPGSRGFNLAYVVVNIIPLDPSIPSLRSPKPSRPSLQLSENARGGNVQNAKPETRGWFLDVLVDVTYMSPA